MVFQELDLGLCMFCPFQYPKTERRYAESERDGIHPYMARRITMM